MNVMWDCVSLVTPDAVESLDALGGIDAIAISHPALLQFDDRVEPSAG